MARIERTSVPPDPVLLWRLQSLIVGRVALILVLLLATWWWINSYLGLSITTFPYSLFLFFVFGAGLSAVYYLLYRTRADLVWQIRGQLLIDTVLVTWLVWQTGDIFSPFITLYIILVTVTGYYLGRSDTLAVAGLSAALFTLLSFTATQVPLAAYSDDQPVSRIAQAIAFNIVGILIVGLLAARLSERRRITEELRHTAESFADLHILHERIVESIGTGLITTDLEGRIFAFNRAAEFISGVKAGEVIGRSVFSLLGDDARAAIEGCLASMRGNEPTPVNFETSFLPRGASDKSERVLVSCSAVPLLAKDGTVNGLIVTFQDITRMKQLEEAVRRSDRLAAVGRMAAGLAHEIRNPLGSMSSALQFLDERTKPATEEASLMKVVLRESDRLNNIITNFLAYARPSANGGGSLKEARTDVGSALRDCLALLSHSPEIGPHHQLNINVPENCVELSIGETELKQVFWNLLRNAMSAMPDGGKLSASLTEISDGGVRIEIRDTGVGIPREKQARLFEPFAEGSTGSGLGLSIVHKIVTDNGGTIAVESEVGKGTAFVIEIPSTNEPAHSIPGVSQAGPITD